MASASILEDISAMVETLPETLARVGHSILMTPELAVRGNVKDVAKAAGVSEAAVVRFAQRLAYKGFRDLQIQLAYELGSLATIERQEIELPANLYDLVHRVHDSNMEALTESVKAMDLEALKAAIALLQHARVVHIFAQGANEATGMDLQYNLMKLGFASQLYVDAYMQVIAAAAAGQKDVVVAISHTGSNRDLLESLAVAHQHNIPALVITARPGSALTRAAEVCLATAPHEIVFYGEPFSSRMTLLFVVNVLVLGLAQAAGAPAMGKLRQVQAALDSRRRPYPARSPLPAPSETPRPDH